MDGQWGLHDARIALAELNGATEAAMELLAQIEVRRRGGDLADDDEAMLRDALREMGKALLDLAGRTS